MSCPWCPPPASEYRRFFGGRMVRMDLRGYRKKGLPRSARALAAAVGGDSVLDVVVLHRVVCCYPDADALVSAAAAHARRSLALTYPRRRPLTRLGFGLGNLWMRVTRCGFRAYVHPFEAIAGPAERQGFELVRRELQGLIWENAVFERLPSGAAGNV